MLLLFYQEDQLPRPRLNGRYRFGQGTLAGTRGNGRDVFAVGTSVTGRPPAQIRTSGFPASGSYLGCLTAKRMLGQG